MAKPHGRTPSGKPANLIGEPLDVRPAPTPGLRITRTEDEAMAKAEKSGVYTLYGARYRINAGDVLPEGAEMDADAPQERKKGPAPENRAKTAPDENRASRKAN